MSFLTLHNTDNTWQATEQRVFSAEEIPALQSVFDLSATLEQEIRQVRQAQTDAVATGFRQGYQEAREQVRRRADEKLAEQLLAQAEDYQSLVAEHKRSVVELALEVTRKIAGKVGRDTWLLAQAAEAVESMTDPALITLVVSEQDLVAMQLRLAQYPDSPFSGAVASDELESGECLLQTPVGRVRISLDSQLEQIRRLLGTDVGQALDGLSDIDVDAGSDTNVQGAA